MQLDPDFPIRQPSLVDQVCEIIAKGISDGSFSPGSLIPSENQLAEQYHVSRSTIRAAFAKLEEQGYVKRKRGVGTFVSESPYLMTPMYHQLDVLDRISAQGLEPGKIREDSQMVEVGKSIADKLSIESGGSVLLVEKVFTANDRPIVWFVGYIPQWVFEDYLSVEQVLIPGITESLSKFFAQSCNTKVKYLISKISPKIAEKSQLPDEFSHLASNTPVLLMENIGFDRYDAPLFLSMESWIGEDSAFHVLRHVDASA